MRLCSLVCVAAALGSTMSVRADLTDPAFIIQATSSLGSGEFAVPNSWAQWNNGVWTWESTAPIEIPNSTGTGLLGILNHVVITYHEDPIVGLTFDVFAGPAPTVFTISSGTLSFPAIPGAIANASAAITVTDANQIGGATMTGGFAGGAMFGCGYNGYTLFGGGTTFADLVAGPIVAPLFGSQVGLQNVAPTPIGPPVLDMATGFRFTLSAGDSASGTSVFNVVVPSPATGTLLCLGLLAMRRRR